MVTDPQKGLLKKLGANPGHYNELTMSQASALIKQLMPESKSQSNEKLSPPRSSVTPSFKVIEDMAINEIKEFTFTVKRNK